MTPIDASFDDFIVRLEENGTVAEVVKQGIHGWLDIQRIKPKSKDTGFTLAFGVKIFDLLFLFLGDGIKSWMGIEEVGDKGKVEFWVTGYEGGWRKEFAAVESVGVLKDLFGSLEEIAGL